MCVAHRKQGKTKTPMCWVQRQLKDVVAIMDLHLKSWDRHPQALAKAYKYALKREGGHRQCGNVRMRALTRPSRAVHHNKNHTHTKFSLVACWSSWDELWFHWIWGNAATRMSPEWTEKLCWHRRHFSLPYVNQWQLQKRERERETELRGIKLESGAKL